MGSSESFLNRIAEGGGARSRSGEESLGVLMESVRRHLSQLLNSCQGMSEALPAYGLPSLVDLSLGMGLNPQVLADAVRATVEKYEPRLERVRVSWDSEQESAGRRPSYRLDAVLVGRHGRQRVWYEVTLSSNGRIAVTG